MIKVNSKKPDGKHSKLKIQLNNFSTIPDLAAVSLRKK
jgi:hypothetical protein